MAGYVVQGKDPVSGAVRDNGVGWDELQIASGGPIINQTGATLNPIAKAIQEVDTWNANLATNCPNGDGVTQGIKVRVMAGIDTPTFAQGTTFKCQDVATSSVHGDCPQFWLTAFLTNWKDFQTRLATAYDAAPEIGELVSARGATIFSEPDLRQILDSGCTPGPLDPYCGTVHGLRINMNAPAPGTCAGGANVCFDSSTDRQQTIDDASWLANTAGWTTTTTGAAFNPFQSLVANPSVTNHACSRTTDSGCTNVGNLTTASMITAIRAGSGTSMENNSLEETLSGAYTNVYADLVAAGGNLAFQTKSIGSFTTAGSLCRTIIKAGGIGTGQYHGYQIELPAGFDSGTAALTAAQVRTLNATFTATGC
jgi:hypothetical protein